VAFSVSLVCQLYDDAYLSYLSLDNSVPCTFDPPYPLQQ